MDLACKAAGIGRRTAYEWRDDLPEFADAWDKALRIGVTALEDEVHRRAFEGTDKPVYHQGKKVGTVREYSDVLAIFLLKAHDPDKYRDQTSMRLTGKDDGPVQFSDVDRAAKVAAILESARRRRAQAGDGDGDE